VVLSATEEGSGYCVQGNSCTGVAFDDLLWMKNQVVVEPGFAVHCANHNQVRSFVEAANVFEGGISVETAKAIF
jgi:hypothetical protein